MEIVERGTGTPLVLIPPLQGRWEYVHGTVDALARSFRVVTFSLRGERGASAVRGEHGLAPYVEQVVSALDARGIDRAVICGISFGGVVALNFAAEHPERTAALVLASTPGPSFHLRPRHATYARRPLLYAPLFVAEVPRRFRREFLAALPNRRDRFRFTLDMARTFLRAPISFRRMGERARLIGSLDCRTVCERIAAPTLVVTGERDLDFVVPVAGSQDYIKLIPGARAAVLERTGHHGTITRPAAFADLVRTFVNGTRHAAA